MKITSSIYLVGGSSESHPADAAVYLVKTGEGAVLIDAGTGGGTQRIVKNIQSAGSDITAVSHLFVTHCHYDHTGGVNGVRRLCGCAVIAHTPDADYLEAGEQEVTAALWYGSAIDPTPVDIKVSEPERVFDIEGTVFTMHHTPGHSPGSAVITMRSDGMLVLFGQDVHGPLNAVLRSSRVDYVKSLEFMMSLNADILCEGHFGVIKGKDCVHEFIESYL